jgi:Flp pilus assembly pilin Flp
MGRLRKFLARRLWTNEEGATLAEYALALFLIAVVTIAAISYLGNSISSVFQNAATSI